MEYISPKQRVRNLHVKAGLTEGKIYSFEGQGKYGFYEKRRYRVSSIVASVLVTKGRVQINETRA